MQTKTSAITGLDLPKLLGGLLVAALLIVLNHNSSGIIRGGDDEGSGIGGTGRSSLPGGESGFGGTGLRPFLGANDGSSVEILTAPEARGASIAQQLDLDIPPRRAIELNVTPSRVAIADPATTTRDSSPILISEQLQREADINALYFERQQEAMASAAAAVSSPRPAEPELASNSGPVLESPIVAEPAPAITEAPLAETPVADPAPVASLASNEPAPVMSETQAADGDAGSWLQLARLIAEHSSDESEQDRERAEPVARAERPERIQRPELPPVQRVRPIQRAAILPPRVRPLRL